MSHDRFIQLLSRKMAGDATIQELDELEILVKHNKEWEKLVEQLSTSPLETTKADSDETDAALAAHMIKMQLSGRTGELTKNQAPVISINKPKKTGYKWFMRIAAVLILAVGGVFSFKWLNKESKQTVATNEVATKKGSRSQVKLPDGTQVWLNADSKLSYAENFTGKFREVTLTGEAFFDVAHDSTKPFIIHTDKINIKVLGTAFNVKSYPQDEIEETSLIRGKIEITFNDRPSEKIILKPNDKLIIRKDQVLVVNGQSAIPKIQLTSVNLVRDTMIAETAWLNNTLAFADQDLQTIAHMLERRFDTKIEFETEAVKQFTYTGTYETESLEKILEFLQVSKPFHFIVKDRKVIISE